MSFGLGAIAVQHINTAAVVTEQPSGVDCRINAAAAYQYDNTIVTLDIPYDLIKAY